MFGGERTLAPGLLAGQGNPFRRLKVILRSHSFISITHGGHLSRINTGFSSKLRTKYALRKRYAVFAGDIRGVRTGVEVVFRVKFRVGDAESSF
jgi:hypothetical protein